MSGDLTRDPVFGEVARSLQAVGLHEPGEEGLPDWVSAKFRGDSMPAPERKKLETFGSGFVEHFWSLAPWTVEEVQCPERERFESAAKSSAWAAALLAASDNSAAAARPLRFMGVVNVTPDSFSDGGRFLDPQRAVEHGLQLVAEGADLLDVGGESTRPGSLPISAEEELCRIKPVIEGLARATRVPISIDTTKGSVVRVALDSGATIVNDVSAGRHDPAMLDLVARNLAGFVAMHTQGVPSTMQAAPRYDDVVSDVTEFLRERCAVALAAGVDRAHLWIDPGIGFGKSLEHNLELLRHLGELRSLGLPILVGVSRKAFIGKITGRETPAADRIGGTAAAVALAVLNGAEILRVHDVAIMREAALVARAIGQAR